MDFCKIETEECFSFHGIDRIEIVLFDNKNREVKRFGREDRRKTTDIFTITLFFERARNSLDKSNLTSHCQMELCCAKFTTIILSINSCIVPS